MAKSHSCFFTGFTADTVQTVIKNTLLNPFLTLPLWLLARYNDRVRGMSLDYPLAFSRLKICMYLGLARYINGFLGQMAQNNWTRAKFNWSKELVLITGGSDGFGKLLTLMFAEKGVKVVIFDIQKPKFDLRTLPFRSPPCPRTRELSANIYRPSPECILHRM